MIYIDFLSQFTDWRPENLYWQRFSIAEEYGKKEVEQVYKEILSEAKDKYKAMTELVMVLNHKSWQHCENTGNSELCNLYAKLFYKAKDYAENTLKGDELRYLIETID